MFCGASVLLHPLRTQLSPRHVQITQRKKHIELCIVLGNPLVARLLILEDVLDHMKRMLNLGANTGLEFLVGQRQIFLLARRHFFKRLSTSGNAPF